MSRQPINWNQEAIDWLKETALGVLILIVFPIATIVAAAAIGSMQ